LRLLALLLDVVLRLVLDEVERDDELERDPDAERLRELLRPEARRVLRRRDDRPPRPFVGPRLTSLLKLLCWPRLVVSCTSSARLFSSNCLNQAFHEIVCSEPFPV
jgi:hypothetical protein